MFLQMFFSLSFAADEMDACNTEIENCDKPKFVHDVAQTPSSLEQDMGQWLLVCPPFPLQGGYY